MCESDTRIKPDTEPCAAPLTHGDVPEQDGSEDPGVGLEFIRDAAISPTARKTTDKPLREGHGTAEVPASPDKKES